MKQLIFLRLRMSQQDIGKQLKIKLFFKECCYAAILEARTQDGNFFSTLLF